MKLSLCMIVKNEEKFIKMCLENALPLVDEAIIVDTGSTDNTKEIIKSFGEKVKLIESIWENDFSKARNISLNNATGDWILMLDADEKLIVKENFRDFIKKCNYEAIKIPFYHIIGDLHLLYSNVYIKIFKNKYRYSGEVHEQLPIEIKDIAELPESIAKIFHFGYMKQQFKLKDKVDRNLRILKDELKQDSSNPFTLYNIGVTYHAMGDYENSLKYIFKSNNIMKSKYANKVAIYEYDTINKIASCLNGLKKYKECVIYLKDITKQIKDFPDLYYQLGEAYEGLGNLDEAIKIYEKCIEVGENQKYISTIGIGSFYPKFKIAKIYSKNNEIMKAASMYIEGVFDKNNIFRKGTLETREYLGKNGLYEILKEFNELIKEIE